VTLAAVPVATMGREHLMNGNIQLNTADLLLKVAGFVTNVNNIFNIERSGSKLASSRWSIVRRLPGQKGISALGDATQLALVLCM
jgi:hypothetical protein